MLNCNFNNYTNKKNNQAQNAEIILFKYKKYQEFVGNLNLFFFNN